MYKHNLAPVFKLFLAWVMISTIPLALAQQNDSNAVDNAIKEQSALDAISTDFTLPVTLVSDNQFMDGKKKTSVFIDNVVIRQGSLEILAQRVEANAGAGTGKEVIMASGNPASYKQRLEDGSMVEAKANEIIYEVGTRTISLKGAASIIQNEIQVTGDSIVFDMAKEQILASSTENSSGPVTTVLSPGAFSTGDANQDSDDEKNQAEKEEDEKS